MSEISRENRICQLALNSFAAGLALLAQFSHSHPDREEQRVSPQEIIIYATSSGIAAELPTPGSLTGNDTVHVQARCDGTALVLSSPQRFTKRVVSPEQYPTLEFLNPGIDLKPVCPNRLDPAHITELRDIIAVSGLATYTIQR